MKPQYWEVLLCNQPYIRTTPQLPYRGVWKGTPTAATNVSTPTDPETGQFGWSDDPGQTGAALETDGMEMPLLMETTDDAATVHNRPSPYPTVPKRTQAYTTVPNRTQPNLTVSHRTHPYLTVFNYSSPYI